MEKEIRNFGIRPDEVKDAAPDYFAARFGVPKAAVHPRAEEWLDQEMSMAELAESLGRLKAIQSRKDATTAKMIAVGLGSDDFGHALTGALRRVIATRYGQESDHRAIAADVPVRDFREHEFPKIDAGDQLSPVNELSEFTSRVTIDTAAGETGRVGTIGALMLVSRQLVINDDVDAINSIVSQITAHASRREAKAVYGVLENNEEMRDGNPLFAESEGNLLVDTNFDKAGLSAAVAALRRKETIAGEEINAPAANVIVPPEREIEALQLITSLSNNRPPMRVVATPWIDAKRWYVTAASDRAPVVGLLRLQDANNTVSVSRAPKRLEYDGLGIKIRADFGAAAMSRVGAIRVEEPTT